MSPETRTKNLFSLLGYQGGTIHEACKEIGLDTYAFLYGNAVFDGPESQPCMGFQRGYSEAKDIALYMKDHKGDLQYWLGAISAVQNNYEEPYL